MRCFLGFPLNKEIKEQVFKKERYIKERGFFEAKFVEKENLHITLAFLGEKKQKEISEISKKIKEIVEKENLKKFNSKICKVGFFPSAKGARVIWLGFSEEAPFINLRNQLGKIIGKDENYIPHITLARIKKINDFNLLKNLRVLINDEEKISKINIYKSILTKKGPIYKVIDSINLK